VSELQEFAEKEGFKNQFHLLPRANLPKNRGGICSSFRDDENGEAAGIISWHPGPLGS
jgi:hypothetical protein